MPRAVDLVEAWGGASPSPLAEAVARRRGAGLPVIDLVGASPTGEGLVFSPELLDESLAIGRAGLQPYQPDPRGQPGAREAIAATYGFGSPDDIFLTPGTSFAYWAIFRLLACEPGAEILVPRPSYPLFDDLAALSGCTTRHYHLSHRDRRGWWLDPEELAFQITPATRAVVLVSPHNPTGQVIDADTMRAIGELAARHHVALILDEVFRDQIHGEMAPSSLAHAEGAPLIFTFNGLSKGHGLPSMKVAWIAMGGADASWRARMGAALEYLLDSFLPVNELAQGATAPLLLKGAGEVRRLAGLLRDRLDAMIAEWRSAGIAVERPHGGPYVLVPLEWSADAAALALGLVEREGILMHPGGLYGLDTPHLVATCVARPPWPIDRIGARLAATR